MFSILRKKTVKVHAYTDDPLVCDYFTFRKGSESYPDWWKKLPKYNNQTSLSSMKGCYGFLEFFKNSFILRAWTDINIKQIQENNFNYDDVKNTNKHKRYSILYSNSFKDGTEASYHNSSQFEGMIDLEKNSIIKLITPWALYCSEDVKFMISDAIYSRQNVLNDFRVLSGITSYKLQHQTNCFLILNNSSFSSNYTIKHNTPLSVYTPLTEKRVEFVHEYNPEMYYKLTSPSRVSLLNNMYNLIKLDKEKNKITCPFGFGKYK